MANRRIEYVFGPPRPLTGHSLGVSTVALAPDAALAAHSYGTLFTGGRDGRINAWALTPHLTQHGTQAARVSDHHTNWVSDLQVVSRDAIASCSADTTVKLWNVAANTIATVGHHTDYAQCLAQLAPDTVVSGGLDERILGWNLGRAGPGGGAPIFDIHAGHSVYAIATAPPNLVVCGFSDGAVRIWDTRQSHYIAKFTGHTDSVRSLFVTQGDTVVSGASDATVRVWSLRSGRVFKTLNQFHSSVWSLHPHQAGFFAGDRDGNIYRAARLDEEPQIAVEHAVREGGLKGLCCDPVTSNLWVGTPLNPDVRCINPQSGTEVERLRGHKGLRKHRLINDKRHALVVDTEGDVGMVDLISAKQSDFRRHIDLASGQNLDDQLDRILDEVNTMDVLDNWCQVQTRSGQICVTLDHRSVNNTEVYLDDLIDHVSRTVKTPFPTPHQSPQGTPGTTPTGSPLGTPQSSQFFRQKARGSFVSPAVSRVTSTQSLAEIVQQRPKSRLGTGQGHAKFYDPDEEANDDESGGPPGGNANRKASQASLYNGNRVDASNLAAVAANAAAAGTASSPSPSATSPFADPPGTTTRTPAPAAAAAAGATPNGARASEEGEEEPADNETADDEIRINLGNYVLENLLRGVVTQLRQKYAELPEPPTPYKSLGHAGSHQGSASQGQGSAGAGGQGRQTANSDGRERKRTRFFNKLFGKKRDDEGTPSSSGTAPNSAAASSAASASSPGAAGSTAGATSASSTCNPDTPQQVKQRVQQQHQNEPDSTSFQESWSRAVANRSLQQADPESPDPDVLSRRARLVVTEIAPGAGAPTEIFSTTVGKLIHSAQEVESIERVLPGWVGDALLLGKLNLKAPIKIGFAVVAETPGLPELTPDSTRLMAISMLRARKIMAYTVGQLQQLKALPAHAQDLQPEEVVSLTCQGVELTPHTTLATIRTRIWRKGGDVVMHYKIKKRA